ncbi:hypothetical protein Leryth_021792, partial [Lithospermum erythrorhizon]
TTYLTYVHFLQKVNSSLKSQPKLQTSYFFQKYNFYVFNIYQTCLTPNSIKVNEINKSQLSISTHF